MQQLPSPLNFNETNNQFSLIPSKLTITYSNYFIKHRDLDINDDQSNPKCTISWNHTVSNSLDSNNFTLNVSNPNNISSLNRFISTINNSLINSSDINNDIEDKKIRFTSISNSNFDFPFLGADNASYILGTKDTRSFFGLMTDCIISKEIQPKNLFHSFEILIEIKPDYSSNNNRVIRLIKLYSEPIFFDSPLFNNNLDRFKNHIEFHHSDFAYGKNQGICIIEIMLNGLLNTESDSLFIIAKNLNLLEIDIYLNEYSYPIINIDESKNRVFAFNSQLNLSSNNVGSKKIFANDILTGYNTFSSYHLFLSSYIIVKTNTLNVFSDSQKNIFIPVYCPNKVSKIENSMSFTESSKSTFIIWTGNKSSINETITLKKLINVRVIIDPITQDFVRRFIHYPNYKTVTSKVSNSTLRFNAYTKNSNDQILYIYNGNSLNQGINDFKCNLSVLLLNSFYSINETNKTSNLYNKVLENNVMFSIGDVNFETSVYTLSNIYVNNQKFKTIAVSVNSSSVLIANSTSSPGNIDSSFPKNVLSSTSFVRYTNIKRPSIENFQDSIGFFCMSKINNENNYMTNFYSFTELPFSFNKFVLDYNPDSTSFNVNRFSTDKSEPMFKDDEATNIFVEFDVTGPFPVKNKAYLSNFHSINENYEADINVLSKLKDEISSINLYDDIPTSSVISVYSDMIDQNTFCSTPVNVKNVYSNQNRSAYGQTNLDTPLNRDCWFSNIIGTIRCFTPRNYNQNNNRIHMCCYSVISKDIISFNSLDLSYYSHTRIDKEKKSLTEDEQNFFFTSSKIYNGINPLQNNFNFITQQSTNLEIKVKRSANIKEIFYSYSKTIGGIGKAYIILNFPREILPNSVYILEGPLNKLKINDYITPNCRISLKDLSDEEISSLKGENKGEGNKVIGNINNTDINVFNDHLNFLYLKSCDLSIMKKYQSNQVSAIFISMKKMILKCGLKMSKQITIELNPILITDYKSNSINKNDKFLVQMRYNKIDIINNNIKVEMIQNQDLYNLKNLLRLNDVSYDMKINSSNDFDTNSLLGKFPINTSKTDSYFTNFKYSSSYRKVDEVHKVTVIDFSNSNLISEESYLLKFDIFVAPYKNNLKELLKNKMKIDDIEIYPELNEVSLFLDQKVFGDYQNDIKCLNYKLNPISCDFESLGILSIKIDTKYETTDDWLMKIKSKYIVNDSFIDSDENQVYQKNVNQILFNDSISFYIYGLKFNPNIKEKENKFIISNKIISEYFHIPFSLNFFNILTRIENQRFNILTGVFYWESEEIHNADLYSIYLSKKGSLQFVSKKIAELFDPSLKSLPAKFLFTHSNSNPNQLSDYYFYFKFDDSFNRPIRNFYRNFEKDYLLESPVIIVSFPSEFELNYESQNFKLENLKVNLEEYFINKSIKGDINNSTVKDKFVIIKKLPIKIKINGNKIYSYYDSKISSKLTSDLLYLGARQHVFNDIDKMKSMSEDEICSYLLKEIPEGSIYDNDEISKNKKKIEFEISNPEDYILHHFKITIVNIMNPGEIQTTSNFNIVLSNNDFSKIYRTFKFNTNFIGEPFSNLFQYDDELLTNYKGVKIDNSSFSKILYYPSDTANINFQGNKSIYTDFNESKEDQFIALNKNSDFNLEKQNKLSISISEISSNDNLLKKQIIAKPGRFLRYRFVIENNLKLSKYTRINLRNSFNSKLFETDKFEYSLSTDFNWDVPFLFGTSCNTLPGSYFIEFEISDIFSFNKLEKSLVFVDNTELGLIEVKNFQNILSTNFIMTKAGNAFIYFHLSDFTFNDIVFNFEIYNNLNDKSAYIKDLNIKRSLAKGVTIASIFSTTVTNSQFFKINNPYTCFKLSHEVISITPSLDKLTILEKIENLSDYFEYSNWQNQVSIKILNEFDKMKFSYYSVMFPAILTCALTCSRDYYFDEVDNLNPQRLNPNDFVFKNSNIFADYSITNKEYSVDDNVAIINLYISNSGYFDFFFSNLLRGFQYDVKCIINSSHSNENLKTKYYLDYNGIFFNKKGVESRIETKKLDSNICHEFSFKIPQDKSTLQILLNACQNDFQYNTENGCIFCIDSFNETISELLYKNTDSCSYSYNLINLSNINKDPGYLSDKSPNKYNKYKICISQSNKCNSDYLNFYELANNWSNSVLNRPNISLNLLSIRELIKQVDIIKDDSTPNIDIKLSNIEYNKVLKFSAISKDRLVCYFKLIAGEVHIPKKMEILACKINQCFKAKLTTEEIKYEYEVDLLSGGYSIWVVCFNDVYYHVNSTDPIKLSSLKVILD